MRNHWILLIALLALVLSGCGSSPTSRQDDDLAPSVPLASPEGDIMEATPVDPGLQKLIEMAKEDLAQRLNISISQIILMEANAVVWPDASLGCPQPGMAYKQVSEDGVLIILQVEGINYEYHNGGSRGLFLCEKALKDSTPPSKIDIFNLTPSKNDSSIPDNSIPPGEDQ